LNLVCVQHARFVLRPAACGMVRIAAAARRLLAQAPSGRGRAAAKLKLLLFCV